MKKIPTSLKSWFVIHFVIDILFAIPLMISPVWLLALFDLSSVDGVTPRLVAAALIGIGGVSFIMRNKTAESYLTMLKLKLLWSASAVFGLVLSVLEEVSSKVWLLILIFTGFFFVWLYYWYKLSKDSF